MSKLENTSSKPAKRPLAKRLFYFVCHSLSRVVALTCFRFRTAGRHNIPAQSGGLVLSTHQSNFDPVLVGLSSNRRLNFLARKTLFKNWAFAALIRNLDAIEIDREGSGLSGLKETMVRLKRNELVLIFPEGTRSSTGHIGPLKPGFISVARRTKVPLIPVAVVGAFEVIPRGTKIPKLLPIAVVFGPMIEPELVSQLDDDQLMAELKARLEECDRQGRVMIGLE
jgi:1-acyl-sn-glycerol-3-phosphate acyltransferase